MENWFKSKGWMLLLAASLCCNLVLGVLFGFAPEQDDSLIQSLRTTNELLTSENEKLQRAISADSTDRAQLIRSADSLFFIINKPKKISQSEILKSLE